MKRVPGVASSKALSFFTCNTTIQSSVASSRPSVSGCHDSRLRSSLLTCENIAIASTSLTVPNQVVPGSGLLASPPFIACDTAFGLPPLLSSELPDQPPLHTLKVGISNPTSDVIEDKA
nr:hypothetical protein CFP56_76294 [Quercus suber]